MKTFLYIDNTYHTSPANSPFMNNLIKSTRGELKTVVYTTDKFPKRYTEHLLSNGVTLSSVSPKENKSFFIDKSVYITSDQKSLDVKSDLIGDIYILDDRDTLSGMFINTIQKNHNVHLLTNKNFFNSHMLNYTKEEDIFYINLPVLRDKSISRDLSLIFPKYDEELTTLANCDIYQQEFFSPSKYLMITDKILQYITLKTSGSPQIEVFDVSRVSKTNGIDHNSTINQGGSEDILYLKEELLNALGILKNAMDDQFINIEDKLKILKESKGLAIPYNDPLAAFRDSEITEGEDIF